MICNSYELFLLVHGYGKNLVFFKFLKYELKNTLNLYETIPFFIIMT